jgi:penicillin-binding protein 1A
MGNTVRSALGAAEVKEDDPGILTDVFGDFRHRSPHRVPLSLQISRTMFCQPDKTLTPQLNELRTAAEMERRFSGRELFTIFANRIYFDKDLVGVEVASQHFFQKEPNQLLVGEAALLAGLVKAPSYFSPIKHPDRALRRRNEVVDAMLEAHTISEAEASTAKTSPLSIH